MTSRQTMRNVLRPIARRASLTALVLLTIPSIARAQASGSWLIMDGPNPGYVEVPNDPALNPEYLTVEAWVYMPSGLTYNGSTQPSIVGTNYLQSWWLSIAGGRPELFTHGSGAWSAATGQIPIGEWVHVAATYDGSFVRFYINGTLDSEDDHDLGPLPSSSSPLRIGSDVSYDVRPHGAIDEVRIWNVVRSESEIASTMNTAISTPMAGLVAVWSLDDGPEATVGGFGGANVGNTVYGNTVPDRNPCIREYFLPSAAHAEGNLGTQWFTDLTLLNIGSGPSEVTLFLLPQDTDNSDADWVKLTIEPPGPVVLEDVVLEQFAEANMSAALRICSDQSLMIDSRTFNAAAKSTATFGQGVPGQSASSASRYTKRLIGVYENDQFRTNLGMLNTSSDPTTVTVRMYDQNYTWLGDKEFKLKPYGYLQRSSIFSRVTNQDVENGLIMVWSDGSPIFVYASVVDNVSGDGTYKLAR